MLPPVEQLWRKTHTRVNVYSNQRNTEKPELLVIDNSIVVMGFNSPEGPEVFRDQKLARSYIAELKSDKSRRNLWYPKEVKREINSSFVRFLVFDVLIVQILWQVFH
jgi:hypothetical protein